MLYVCIVYLVRNNNYELICFVFFLLVNMTKYCMPIHRLELEEVNGGIYENTIHNSQIH